MRSRILAVIFLISGICHFATPKPFIDIVPNAVPARSELVAASGAAELACAAGLITRRRWAPWASAALLLAVFPANVQMAIDWQNDASKSTLLKVLAWVRLPLQIPLIALAWRSR